MKNMLTTCMCLDSIMNVYDESEKGKDRNYLYKNAERKKIKFQDHYGHWLWVVILRNSKRVFTDQILSMSNYFL